MLTVVGTVPDPALPVISGRVRLSGDRLEVNGHTVDLARGTPALLAAAVKTSEALDGPPVAACLVGDIGTGHGSRRLYEFLTENIRDLAPGVVTFHYLQPDVDWHNKVLFAVDAIKPRPLLIADAGFMYAAKMSGLAGQYDLFTPDVGELAFLADEDAPHPFYTRGFILHDDDKTGELIGRAYAHGNAAQHMLVKGQPDVLAHQGEIIGMVDAPVVEAMEAIGGTGDTLTGVLSALVASGRPVRWAALAAARVNRLAGEAAGLSPASQVLEIIGGIPAGLERVLK